MRLLWSFGAGIKQVSLLIVVWDQAHNEIRENCNYIIFLALPILQVFYIRCLCKNVAAISLYHPTLIIGPFHAIAFALTPTPKSAHALRRPSCCQEPRLLALLGSCSPLLCREQISPSLLRLVPHPRADMLSCPHPIPPAPA